MKGVLMVASLSLFLAACASVESSPTPGIIADNSVEGNRVAAIRNGDKDPDSEVICKSQPITGSRAMKRVCHTRAEWVAMRRNGEDSVRTTLQKATMHFENEACGRVGNGSCGN